MATTNRRRSEKTKPQTRQDDNERFLVLRYECLGDPGEAVSRYEVYLLNPGDFFRGFACRDDDHPIVRTGSLIVRRTVGGAVFDREYNIADKKAWRYIHVGLAYNLKAAAKDAIAELESAKADGSINWISAQNVISQLTRAIEEHPGGD